MEAIQSTASQVLVNLALGVIGLLGAYAVYYIQKAVAKVNEQTKQIKDEAARKLLNDALEDVETLVTVTVGSIEQTTAAALRAAVKDGTTNRDELLALGKKAFSSVKSNISIETQETITKNLGSFNVYLTNLIETKVLQIKSLGSA